MVLTRRLLITALALSVVILVLPATVWVCAAAVMLLVIADVLLAASPRRVRVVREDTPAVRAGEPVTARTLVENVGSRTLRGQVKDGWQPSAGARRPVQDVTIPAGERQLVEVPLRPQRRGNLRSEHLTVRSVGPLGMAGRQVVHRVPHAQRVLPPFSSRKHLPSKLQRLRELDGATAVQRRGAGTEFDSLRDYVHGDDVRSIDWRATARRHSSAGQHLVVRTWRPERDRRVILCLDASRTSAARIGGVSPDDQTGAADQPRLDTSMEAALLLGALASSAGDRVDFLAFHRDLVSQASSRSAGDFLHSMAHAMSQVSPVMMEADFSQLPAEVAAISSQRSLVVILTSLGSASLQEGLLPVLPALTAKHRVLIASVQDPELTRRITARQTVADVYSAAAAERSLIESEALIAELSALQVDVVEETPENLPPALADAYIRLKASGKL
ncbi:DUF58 domain-containing protein [Nesterenkonia flava]|uniref:DUF58 domain-containing protein n=1 Tax=Nesterenkonia flava TaxID=469799 RepID=A0ABU1FWG5_9MICC|nr:DUF58 domain-containing protein [Nesterenkonia flava]MDR5712466.1 DUF58 domain-containing protein [Nesterenkonia flava]